MQNTQKIQTKTQNASKRVFFKKIKGPDNPTSQLLPILSFKGCRGDGEGRKDKGGGERLCVKVCEKIVCIYVCMYVCTYVRTYVCMYVCVWKMVCVKVTWARDSADIFFSPALQCHLLCMRHHCGPGMGWMRCSMIFCAPCAATRCATWQPRLSYRATNATMIT